jgi:hypothetical protein
VAVHPFRAAWQTRDLDAWIDALAPGVVLHSPVVQSPFVGRQAARELYSVLFEHLRDVEITDELGAGDSHAFFWSATAAGRRIEGADLVRTDRDGKIDEVRVLIRPLVNIGTFVVAAGPPMAARRGRARELLLRVVSPPLRALFAAVDAIATRVIQLR